MKYDRSKIMKDAWSNYRIWSLVYANYTFAQALRQAWYYAKKEASKVKETTRYNVIGYRLYNDKRTVIASGVDADTAARVKYYNAAQFDKVEVEAA